MRRLFLMIKATKIYTFFFLKREPTELEKQNMKTFGFVLNLFQKILLKYKIDMSIYYLQHRLNI